MTSVTLYGGDKPSTTLSTAGQFFSATGGTQGTPKVAITTTGWGEMTSFADAAAWEGQGSEMTTPTGSGWLWDVTTLEGQTLSGTPTIKLNCQVDAGQFTGVLHVRFFKRSSDGTYTSLGSDAVDSSRTFTSTAVTPSIVGSALTPTAFGTGDKLYVDMPANVTAQTTSPNFENKQANATSTSGVAGDMEIDGLSYVPTVGHVSICDGLGGVFT